jgi:hypothetical protein
VLGYLLGSEQKVTVEGAENANDETPTPGAAERASVLLGGSVMMPAWNPQKQRPTTRVYDPGFFFPQEDDEDEDTESGAPGLGAVSGR